MGILNDYKNFTFDGSEESLLKRNLKISISDLQGHGSEDVISYEFPSNIDELKHLEEYWFCPTIFSLFDSKDFLALLTSVLLEHSLVFVSNNLTILSNIILGLRTLISPFDWCYAMIQVLPTPLLDHLESP